MKGSDFPIATPGQRIGLFGGSFDPAHAGHVYVTKTALKRFGLDQVWWLVSPGNPLKQAGPAPLEKRIARAREIMMHPRVVVSGLEAKLGTRYTAKTLEKLLAMYPGVSFTWVMGEDNLAQFHHWQDWTWIANVVPIGIIARPGAGVPALNTVMARKYREFRLPARQSQMLSHKHPPAWCLINTQLRPESSTDLRKSGVWSSNAKL